MMMNETVEALCQLVGGQLTGDGQRVVRGVAPFERADETDITFAIVPKLLKNLDQTRAGVVIVPEGKDYDTQKSLIKVRNPHLAFIKIVKTYYPAPQPKPGIYPGAHIGDNFQHGPNLSIAPGVVVGDQVTVGANVTLGANCVLGNQVTLGDDVVIKPNVTILDGCIIGNRVIIHSGTVIGSDGFGFVPDGGVYHKIPHLGIVRIDDDVEIGANNTIDRGTFGETYIGRGVKTDNLVHVAHNVQVGEHTVLVAQVGIAGSAKIGKQVILAGQVGVTGHLTIGDNVTVGPQSGIAKSVPNGQIVSGSPEMPHATWRRMVHVLPKLPEMQKQLAKLEKRLAKLEENPDE